jgi:hypothetical protein
MLTYLSVSSPELVYCTILRQSPILDHTFVRAFNLIPEQYQYIT